MSDLSRHGITPPRPITPLSATAATRTISGLGMIFSKAGFQPG
jgi:hypothetical protein